jgi:hypothetical protein
MLAVVLGLSLIASLFGAPAAGAADERPDPRSSPPPEASLRPDQLDALRAVREERPAALRGVLAAIAANPLGLGTGGGATTRPDLAGLVTRTTAAGTTHVAVSIEIRSPLVRALLDRLERLGVQVVNRSETSVEAYLSPAVLELVAGLPGVDAIEPVLPTMLQAVVSAGVGVHGASPWQAAGYLGAGIRVGIIDGGFTGMAALLGTELPGSVHARCYTGVGQVTSALSACEAEGIDHGTAVAETIVDMAPGVSLYVANPFSLLDYQRTVTWMAQNGVKVINASLATAYEGPGDGTDPTGGSLYTIITQASNAGILWVNSAGNSGENGWFGPWADPDGDRFLNFEGDDQENSLVLVAGQQAIVTARWNEAWGRARNDYDIGVFDTAGSLIASSVDVQNGNDDPVETLIFEAPASATYHIVATRHSGAAVSRFQILVLTSGDSPLEHQVPAGTIPTPVDSRATGFVAVGAVDVSTPGTIEDYSSRGPTVDNRIKPDVVAGDCGVTTTFGAFCGTSQSAPYVTGAAALLLEAFPKSTAAQAASLLRSRAVPLGTSSPNNTFGYGRLELGAVPGLPVPTGLAFQAQPGGAVEGAALSTQPVVRVTDADGATVAIGPGATTQVTISLDPNPTGGVLTCQTGLTVAALAGVAPFDGCAVDRPGRYGLRAEASGLPAAASAEFTVTGVPIRLAFAADPADTMVGQPFAAPLVVAITNGSGATRTTGTASTMEVTLAIDANSAAASLTCAGGTTVTAVGGIATFPGCAVSAPGAGYTLIATAAAAVPTSTAPFDIVDPSGILTLPALAISSSATAIRWGDAVQLAARLTVPDGSVAVGARRIRLQRSVDGTTWSNIAGAAVTDASGLATISYRPATNAWYRAVVEQDPDLAIGTGSSTRVTVRQLALVRPTNAGKVKVVPRRTRIEFKVTVRPSSAAVPPGDATLQVYRRSGGAWQLVSTQVATPDAAGVASIFVTFASPGSYYVRGQANPTPVNANSGWSPVERYDVR